LLDSNYTTWHGVALNKLLMWRIQTNKDQSLYIYMFGCEGTLIKYG